MLEELRAQSGVEEILEIRSTRIGFLALHGGNQDRLTDVIARRAAERSGASIYALVQPSTLRWHIPSHRYDPGQSPALADFLDRVELAISVHGYGRDSWWFDYVPPQARHPDGTPWTPRSFLLGGRDRELARHVGRELRARLPGYRVLDDLDAIPKGGRGVHPRNPVNLTRGGGAQVEVPPGPRGLVGGSDGETELVVGALATAAASVGERTEPPCS